MAKVAKKNAAKNAAGSTKGTTIKRSYPRRDLKDAVLIPLKIKEYNGGNPWTPDDVAKALGIAPKSSEFFYWTAAARDYGLTEGTRDTAEIKLTELGRKLVYAPDAATENAVKQEAFFNIKVFKDVFEYYGGNKLPEIKYLSNTLENNFSLDPLIHEEFLEIFKSNCDFVGQLRQEPNGATLLNTSPTRVIAEPASKTNLKIFVALPFSEKNPDRPAGFFSEVLINLIVPAGTGAGFNVETANRQGSDIIQSTIMTELIDADLVLADLTDHNPNVLFELGFRIALGKPVVIIKAKGTKGIFDIDSMMRYYEYDANLWKSSLERDLPALQEHVKAAWENKDRQPSYLKILTK